MTEQRPLGSGFSAKSTAEDVMRGVDLTGKTAIVTGGYSGIGLETTAALARAGARVLVPARNPAKAEDALGSLKGDVAIGAMDLGDLKSVEAFARSVVDDGRPVHLLINNAGIMACPLARLGRAWESQFATNHLGHFVLTRALLPLLRKADGARVVSLSSLAHRRSDILWDDPHLAKTPYDKWVAYGQSKTANSLFAVELDAREKANGIRAFAVHPGGIITPLQRHLEKQEMVAIGWIDESGELSPRAREMFKTPSGGASTTLWCATAPRLSDEGGVYCEDCDVAELAAAKASSVGTVRAYAVDPTSATRLWRMTESMLA